MHCHASDLTWKPLIVIIFIVLVIVIESKVERSPSSPAEVSNG
jgi:hypothetical protein